MKIGERDLGEHLRLLAPLFGFIAAVWALRLVLDFAGAPPLVVHFCSVTLAGALSILFAVLLIYFKRFGGYLNVIACAILLAIWEQGLISAALVFTLLTGLPTIYNAPRYSFQMTVVRNLLSHVTFGLGFGSLFGAAMGCLLFLLLRVMVPPESLQRHG
jgi:hypothetical protein